MPKRNRSDRGSRPKSRGLLSPEQYDERIVPTKADKQPLKPKTDTQAHYLNSIKTNILTFGIGPAGTGKTYVAASYAAEALANREIERLIITRPAVEAGEKLGFLPGELEEKFDPYFAPVREILNERLGSGHVEAMLRSNRIIVKPLAYMRGATFKDCVVILDEAQNTTPVQMKLFLTRVGEHAKFIINGDLKQQDVYGKSGLADAIERVGHLKSVGVTRFKTEDIVRSGLARLIVEAYENEEAFNPPNFLKEPA